MLITSARRFRESAYAFCTRYVPPDGMAASNKPHAKNTNGMPHELLTPIPQTQSTSHPHAQRSAFRRRDVRRQSRSFALWNPRLRHSRNSSFAKPVGYDLPVRHAADSAAFALHTVGADRAGTLTTAQIYIEKSRSYSFGNLLDAI